MVGEEEFRAFLRLLEQQPEWRAEVRRWVLSEELLRLPEIVRELAEAQQRSEGRLSRLEEAIAQLIEAQRHTQEEVAAMAEAQRRMVEQITTLVEVQRKLEGRVSEMYGKLLELRYERHAPAYFIGLARRIRVVSKEELQQLLETALERALLSEEEYEDLLRADLVVRGQRRKTGEEVYFVMEISAGIGISDVERAIRRARLFSKLGIIALPVVAGEWIIPEAEEMARAWKVAQVLNGRLVSLEQ